jgi:hypothetical protein
LKIFGYGCYFGGLNSCSKEKTMVTTIGADTAKLAGLQIDQLQKVRDGQLTLEQIEWWLHLRTEVRDRYMQPDFKDVVRGTSQIVAIEHVIDCDADPFVPEGWAVESHKKGGLFKWDATKVKLYLSKNQKGDKYVQGHKLREELENQPVLNANVLDYLLARPELIPEEWKGKYVFFWGTVYRYSDGYLSVRCLCWGGGRWSWLHDWLGSSFYCDRPAACSQV